MGYTMTSESRTYHGHWQNVNRLDGKDMAVMIVLAVNSMKDENDDYQPFDFAAYMGVVEAETLPTTAMQYIARFGTKLQEREARAFFEMEFKRYEALGAHYRR